MVQIEFSSPAGTVEITAHHAPRLDSMDGKRIAFLSNDEWQSTRSLPLLKQLFEADFPQAEILPIDTFPRGTNAIGQESTIRLVLGSGVDAVVIGAAACGACATACGVAAARLEAAGVPTVILAREDFANIVRNTISGSGLPPDAPMVTFPMELFMPGSDLEPLETRHKEFHLALTDWALDLFAADEPSVLTVEADTYESALEQANNLLLASLWGDGLPMWPATEDRISWILQGTDLPADHVLGKFPPRGARVTVRSCAIALAMAGGRPEYLPILVAGVEALMDPGANSEQMQATSGAAFPVLIVTGPVAKDIRLGSGYGCLGPDPQHPAGASIGRALRQMQQNLGGAVPGVGTLATWGADRTTNIVFAEDEAGLPDGWSSHAAERHGFEAASNSVSLIWVTGATNLLRGSGAGESRETDVRQGLFRMADLMSAPHMFHFCEGYDDGTPGIVLVSSALAAQLHAEGFTTKDTVRQFLWEHSGISRARLDRTGGTTWIERADSGTARANLELDEWPISARAANITLVVAGGSHPMHSFWMPAYSQAVVGRPVLLPDAMGSLLNQADRALGCAADICVLH